MEKEETKFTETDLIREIEMAKILGENNILKRILGQLLKIKLEEITNSFSSQ